MLVTLVGGKVGEYIFVCGVYIYIYISMYVLIHFYLDIFYSNNHAIPLSISSSPGYSGVILSQSR